jgi:hypothetical protein
VSSSLANQSLVAPALQVEHRFQAYRKSKLVTAAGIATRAWCASAAARARAIALPGAVRMIVAYPTNVVAADAFH